MREIKLRAWNTRRKEMESFRALRIMIDDLYWFEENQCHHNGDNDYVIQQYTGLKDKNGVEIYEGDILLDKNGAKYSVFWHDTDVEFSLSIMNEDEVDDFLISLCWRNVSKFHLEIVGNIFEGVDK